MAELHNIAEIKETIKREGNYRFFSYKGYNCFILRPKKGALIHLCGYIMIPRKSSFFGKQFAHIPLAAHGGLTYSAPFLYGLSVGGFWSRLFCRKHWFIGFDCAHAGDIFSAGLPDNIAKSVPSEIQDKLNRIFSSVNANDTYKDMQFVESELKNLVEQIIEIDKKSAF